MKTRLFLLGIVCIVIQGKAPAQSSDVRGVVSDSLTRERIPFVNIILRGTSRGAAANAVGFFLIPNVPPGQYEIVLSAVGYARVTRAISVEAGRSVEFNAFLPPVAIETGEVLISAESKQKLLELHTSMHVMGAAEMKVAPVQAQNDVLQSLKILPGIVSTSDASSKFFVRGGAGDQNLFLLDGMKIYNPYHALGIFSVFDPDIVRTTEVYTGAFPAGYGGRLSSVVSLSTRDGKLNRLSGHAQANLLSTKLRLEGPVVGGLSFLVNGRKSLYSKTFDRIVHANAPAKFYDVFLKATSLDTSGSKLDVSMLSSADDLQFADPKHPDYFWRNYSVGVVSSGLTGDRLFVVVSGSWSSFHARVDPKASTTQKTSSTKVVELSVRALATYYSDQEDFYTFGFDLAFPKLEYDLVNAIGVNRHLAELTTEASTWVTFQSTFGRFLLSTGLHVEVGSLFYRRFSQDYLQPRLSLSYRLTDSWRVKVAYGAFTQNVFTATNEDDVVSVFDPWIHVPQNLQSQQSNHYVLGVEGPVRDNVWTSVQVYFKDNTSLVTYNRDKVDAADPDYINTNGVSYGAEFLGRSDLGFVELYGTYALSVATLSDGVNEYHPRYDRRHHVNLMATIRPITGMAVTLRWEYGSGFPYTQSLGYFDRLNMAEAVPGPFEQETGRPYILLGEKNAARLPAYHRLDVGTTYNFSLGPLEAEAGLHILNLYDNHNVFYFDRATGQRVDMLPFFPSLTFGLEF